MALQVAITWPAMCIDIIRNFAIHTASRVNSNSHITSLRWMARCNSPNSSTPDNGMSKHRLSPYYAYYHKWHTLNFTASDSSSDERCFLKVLIVRQLMQLAGSIFQLSITLLEQELIIEMRNPNVTWRIIWHVYLFTTELRHTCSSLLFFK